tara:strand:+ start:5704 stop:6573 length:870 start_codon:yes stop_codon:yes gene_type:complete
MFFSFINFSNSFITRSLIKNISPKNLRSCIYEDLHKNHKYITYENAKNIFHNKISFIDIYGDKKENMNLEHIFPQYMFKNDVNKKIMKSDLHNLYLCNSKLNTFRQNFTYVDSQQSKHLFTDNTRILDQKGDDISNIENIFEKQGYFMISDKKKKIFLPTSYSRGKIARSLAYFAIRYNYINELKNIINLETLLTWNFLDPVNNEEYLKNIICYKYQKNLNPFIINSDLLYYCLSDYVNIDENILIDKKLSEIDPLITIDFLLKELDDIENINKKNQNVLNKFTKKNKK